MSMLTSSPAPVFGLLYNNHLSKCLTLSDNDGIAIDLDNFEGIRHFGGVFSSTTLTSHAQI